MKRTKICKKLITLASVACLSLAALLTPMATLSAQAQVAETVSPCSDDIRWVLKEINGSLYRRLYNYTKDCWASSYWEFVCKLS